MAIMINECLIRGLVVETLENLLMESFNSTYLARLCKFCGGIKKHGFSTTYGGIKTKDGYHLNGTRWDRTHDAIALDKLTDEDMDNFEFYITADKANGDIFGAAKEAEQELGFDGSEGFAYILFNDGSVLLFNMQNAYDEDGEENSDFIPQDKVNDRMLNSMGNDGKDVYSWQNRAAEKEFKNKKRDLPHPSISEEKKK